MKTLIKRQKENNYNESIIGHLTQIFTDFIPLMQFTPMSVNELEESVLKSPSKSCMQDPMPN